MSNTRHRSDRYRARSPQRSLCPHRPLESEGARKGLYGGVLASAEHAEVAVATERGVVAGPSDDRKRTRLIARLRRRRVELGMELDGECSAAVVAGEDLPNREGGVESAAP